MSDFLDCLASSLWQAEPIAAGQNPRRTLWTEEGHDMHARYCERVRVMLELAGIPAATLAGLRNGSLVAVPRDDLTLIRDMLGQSGWRAMKAEVQKWLAAAQDRTP